MTTNHTTRRELVECYKRVFELQEAGQAPCPVTGYQGTEAYHAQARLLRGAQHFTPRWASIGARRQAISEHAH